MDKKELQQEDLNKITGGVLPIVSTPAHSNCRDCQIYQVLCYDAHYRVEPKDFYDDYYLSKCNCFCDCPDKSVIESIVAPYK